MSFMKCAKLKGSHAPFSPSNYHWINYDDDKLLEVYSNLQAKKKGTILHGWAKLTIDLGRKQPRSSETLCSYINDAIKYRMNTEVLLYYSDYFFGWSDAISFKKNLLRIHDLKTGKTPAHMEQLLLYAALFCLGGEMAYTDSEGDIKEVFANPGCDPYEIGIELRIYQNDDIDIYEPEPDEILELMDNIIHKNKLLEQYDLEG